MPDIMKLGDPPQYLGSWDCTEGELILTIADFKEEVIEGDKGRKERKCIMYFAEKDVRPMVVNLTNRKMLAKLYHTTDSNKLKGKLVKIGTEKVRAFGAEHDALRIRPVVPAQASTAQTVEIKCEECGKAVTAAYNMDASKLAEYTKAKFGRKICAACAEKAAKDGAE